MHKEKKSHLPLILCLVYSLYLGLGGVVFMYLEWDAQETLRVVEFQEWITLKELISNPNSERNDELTKGLVEWLSGRCSHFENETEIFSIPNGKQSDLRITIEEKCSNLSAEVSVTSYKYPWGYMDSLYFSMTVATTIGYGHISPSTTFGRMACIVYAVIGIPLTMVLLTWTSDFFGELLFLLFQAKLDKQKQSSKFFIALGTSFYIAVGFLVFIFLPPIIFMHIEHWTYLEGVYYSFITLTTIGFGDFVTGRTTDEPWVYVYQIAVIIWILSGLGYWVMIANFITRAMHSKKIQSFAKRATDIKKLMNQVGLTQAESTFLTQHSKTSLNFLMQLSSSLILPELAQGSGIENGPNTTVFTPPVLPGIASLFGNSGLGGLLASMPSHIPNTGHAQAEKTLSKGKSEENFGDQSPSSLDSEDTIVYLNTPPTPSGYDDPDRSELVQEAKANNATLISTESLFDTTKTGKSKCDTQHLLNGNEVGNNDCKSNKKEGITRLKFNSSNAPQTSSHKDTPKGLENESFSVRL